MLKVVFFVTAFTAVVTQDLLGVSYYFDDNFRDTFSVKKCENSTQWDLVSYEYLDVVPPYIASSKSIKATRNSCTSSFPIVFLNGTLELTVYLRTVAKSSGLTVVVFDDEDDAITAVRYQRSNKYFITGWTVISIPIKQHTNGYIQLSGQSLKSELIIVDSLRYIPDNTTIFLNEESIKNEQSLVSPNIITSDAPDEVELFNFELDEIEGSGGSDEDDLEGSGGYETEPPVTDDPDSQTEDPTTSTDDPDELVTDDPGSQTDEPTTSTDDPDESATDDPGSQTDEPTTSTDDPDESATDDPGSQTDEPTTSTDDPDESATDDPGSQTDEPTTSTDDPDESATDDPGSQTDEPTTSTDDPDESATDDPGSQTDEPTTSTDDPDESATDDPGSQTDEPTTSTDDPDESATDDPGNQTDEPTTSTDDPEESATEDPDIDNPGSEEETDENSDDPGFWNAFTITFVSVGSFVAVGSIGVGAYYLGMNRAISTNPPIDIEALEAPSEITVPRVRSIFSDTPSRRFSRFS